MAGFQLNVVQPGKPGIYNMRPTPGLRGPSVGQRRERMRLCKILKCYVLAANDNCHFGYRVSPEAYPSICYTTRVRRKPNKQSRKGKKKKRVKKVKKNPRRKTKRNTEMRPYANSFPCYAPPKKAASYPSIPHSCCDFAEDARHVVNIVSST